MQHFGVDSEDSKASTSERASIWTLYARGGDNDSESRGDKQREIRGEETE
jgi:hypothetical protein